MQKCLSRKINLKVMEISDCCPSGTFGVDCKFKCHCNDPKEPCNSNTGACHTGCAPGWEGPNCALGKATYRNYASDLQLETVLLVRVPNANTVLAQHTAPFVRITLEIVF